MNPSFSSALPVPSEATAPPAYPHRASFFGSREALWAALAGALLALAFSAYYLGHTVVMNEADPRLLAEFRGHRPYQLRILMPFLAHWSAHFTGLDLVRCYQILALGFSVALFAVFGAYLRVWCAPRAARWLALTVALPLFAFYSHRWFYPYDVPAIFFATLGLLLMAQRRFAFYLLVFTLATLNRETSAFLILIWVLALRDGAPHPLTRRVFWGILVAQIGIWLTIRLVLSHLFAGNAGATFELQWSNNARDLLAYWNYVDFELGAATLMLIGLWFLGWATRRYQPAFLCRARGAFWPFMGLMSIVGVLVETRIYGELIPILLAPALIGIWNWTQARSA